MCGIIAVIRRRADRAQPAPAYVLDALEPVPADLHECAGDAVDGALADRLTAAAIRVEQADRLLRGVPGTRALMGERSLAATIDQLLAQVGTAVGVIDRRLDNWTGSPADLEPVNAAMVRLRDAAWAVGRDRLRTARAVADLAGPGAGPAAVEACWSIQVALSAIDRLEVRGRDSAGVHVLVRGHGLDTSAPATAALLAERNDDELFGSLAVRLVGGCLGFVYKAAAEVGELGDNTSVIRDAIRGDPLLHRALESNGAEAVVLGHTRWASVGIISEPNAHPVNSDEVESTGGSYVVAALNGDVDNFAELKADAGLRIPLEITTDAKVIPTLVSRRRAAGADPVDAFRGTVAGFDGSVAIAASAADTPDHVLLALRGSGQGLYVGLADDCYVVASEPYGVVEEADRYLRLDGEVPADADNPTATRGQIVDLDGSRAGTVEGIRRLAYDGTGLPVAPGELTTPEITTRDIDRGDHPHYLLKEITESPGSFRKTLRGKVVEAEGRLTVDLGPDTLPPDLVAALTDGRIVRVLVIGQGTAAVAGQALARALTDATAGTDLRVDATQATELSGFGLRPDMSDTLVIAVSQSGTTTDTNRTVDLVRARGARVVSIVNRRRSDLVDRSDGVLYTSDGRDVEMSVASTKAFYSQVAAGFLLAFAVAERVRPDEEAAQSRSDLLEALRELPSAMEATLATRDAIAAAAQLAPSRRHWAVVGSGPDRIAAMELRIKLSELCYKAIACDATEDKKHIDLSSEPLILVCATGLSGSNADDVAKEIAIYRAHKATPIVIASEGEERFGAAAFALTVPAVHPSMAFVLATVVGHLFGYEAALAIDAQARPLRLARAAVESSLSAHDGDGDLMLASLRHDLDPVAATFFGGIRTGSYDGHLEAGTAVRLASLLRYATGIAPLDGYEVEYGQVGTPGTLIEALTASLTTGIEELTRPIDAIKHQAKTVTVGISRSDEGLLHVPLVAEALARGAPRDRLSYRSLRTIARLDPAVEAVTGYTRYRIDGMGTDGGATIAVIDRGGISLDKPLRTERNPRLRGTKRRVAEEREVTVAVGRVDGATIVIIPEVKGNQTTGITLLHVRFRARLAPAAMRSVLEGYRDRYSALRDVVTETEPTMRDDLLGEVAVIDLLTHPVRVLAEIWWEP